MKNIVNMFKGHVTEDTIYKFVCGIVLVITIGMMIYNVGIIGENSYEHTSLIDEHLEALEVLTDELWTEVMEYNEAYYGDDFDEWLNSMGMADAIPFLFSRNKHSPL